MLNRQAKERIIENYLTKYNTYKVGMKNCQKQLDYMMPSLTARYESDGCSATFFIANDTEKVALDRITSKRALDLIEEIEYCKLIIESIDNAFAELDEKEKQFVELRYFKGLKVFELKPLMHLSEEKTFYRIRRQLLDKLLISLNNLICLK
jgi:DNA-directed RNA polymerase specialized sigma subunit